MVKSRKVLTIVGTRPELIRLSRTIARLDEIFIHILVHTGQNYDYELNEVFFEELAIKKPDYFLEAAGETAAETIANTIASVDRVLLEVEPDAVLILGDTNSCLSVIPAKRRHIPVFHMEAGNRCYDMRVPEEINRVIVDHVSDINLCYSDHARRNLLAESIPSDRVIKTGSPMKEVLDHYSHEICDSDIHSRLKLSKSKYFVVSTHREENVDNTKNLRSILEAINALATEYKIPIIVSLHPRTEKMLINVDYEIHSLVNLIPPTGFFDYVALQKDAFCTISDSGTISEESAILGFPAVNLREAHERPEAMDEAVVVMSGLQSERVLEAVRITRAQFDSSGAARIPPDYDVNQVSWKVAKIIAGYIEYVKRRTWFELSSVSGHPNAATEEHLKTGHRR